MSNDRRRVRLVAVRVGFHRRPDSGGVDEPLTETALMRDRVVLAAAVLASAPGALAATTVTYNAGGTSPGMNVVDDPGNAVHLVVTSGTFSTHVGLRSNNGLPLTAGSGCLRVSETEVTCFA